MTRPRRRGPWSATALLLVALALAACGATTAPEANPANTPTAPATFDDATFDVSSWR